MARVTRRLALLILLVLCAPAVQFGCTAGLLQSSDQIESSAPPSNDAPGTTTPIDGNDPAAGGTVDIPAVIPFEPQGPEVYVNKIKTIVTGLPALPQEVASGATAGGLADLVDGWMKSDAYQATLMTFFKVAFQLSLFNMEQIGAQVPYGNHPRSAETAMLLESFPRTVLDIVNNNRPFTEVATTTRFMMTPRLLLFYSLIDQFGDGKTANGDYFKAQNPNATLTMTNAGGASDLADLTNPASKNYLSFPWATLQGSPGDSGCAADYCMQKCGTVTIPPNVYTYGRGGNVWTLLNGGGFIYFAQPGNKFCLLPGGSQRYLTATDDTTWRMVSIRTPKDGESPAKIYDLNTFRTASEVVFRIPRVGFYTQPAFLGQWDTNANNQARSTINQTLVVGLERVFDGSDRTVPSDLRALPLEHAQPNSTCYSCHVTMDPMRQYFLQQMNFSYHPQHDADYRAIPGAWGQNGTTVAGGDIGQLGRQIASDPDFALAWVSKTCAWINSGPCDKRDPELLRIAKNFAASQFNFHAMFKDMLLSPLTTYKQSTLTATQRGLAPTIARRDQFCKIIGQRIEQPQICSDGKVSSLLNGYPTDGYSRGTTVLAQARIPSLVTRLALENICAAISVRAIDASGSKLFTSGDPAGSIKNLMSKLMGLDPEEDPAVLKVLTGHFDDAKKSGLTPANALRSSFVVACLSPFVSTIGH